MVVHAVQAKRKYMEAVQEKQNLEADRAELQQKYSQKAQQARKLQDMFQKLQHENEMLRSGQHTAGNAPTAGNHFMRSNTPPLNSNLADPGGNMVRMGCCKETMASTDWQACVD